jgi:hypothetical protein
MQRYLTVNLRMPVELVRPPTRRVAFIFGWDFQRIKYSHLAHQTLKFLPLTRNQTQPQQSDHQGNQTVYERTHETLDLLYFFNSQELPISTKGWHEVLKVVRRHKSSPHLLPAAVIVPMKIDQSHNHTQYAFRRAKRYSA